MAAQCEICGTEMTQGRGRARRTCSAACRQAAHRRRQAAEVDRLRAAATQPAAPAVPAPPPAPAAPDDSPAGEIRAASRQLLDAIEAAARRAADDWPGSETTPEADAAAVRHLADQVTAAILASAPQPSRNEPPARVTPATVDSGPVADTGPSRNEPPTARKRLSHKAAMALVDSAQLVKADDHRDSGRWNLVADDGTVLGRILPSYGGASRRNGWRWQHVDTVTGGGPHKRREDAAVQCADAWVRAATAPTRRTLTGRD
jgi:hypothetical protein